MAVKTFIPKLVAIVTTLCIYITRYRNKLDGFLATDEQRQALAVLAEACTAFLLLVEIQVDP